MCLATINLLLYHLLWPINHVLQSGTSRCWCQRTRITQPKSRTGSRFTPVPHSSEYHEHTWTKKQQGLVRRAIVRKNVSSQFHRILVFIWRSLERNWNNLLFTVKNTHVHFLLSVTVTFTPVAKQSRFLSYTDKYVNTALSHQTLVIQCFKKREDKSYDFQLESWILFQ